MFSLFGRRQRSPIKDIPHQATKGDPHNVVIDGLPARMRDICHQQCSPFIGKTRQKF